jgi:L-alanine-DL-glutamate epimerase-like enolase superfamily enzyme
MALMAPGMPNAVPPVYGDGYSDQPESVTRKSGGVPVPDGPGLGVTYDWDLIERNAVETLAFR